MYDVTMPKLSDSMATGKVVAWKVKPGDKVRAGDVLAEVESDKAVMELECFRDGTVAEILHEADSEVAVGEVIARIAVAEGTVPQAPVPAQKNETPAVASAAAKEAEVPKPTREPAPPTPQRRVPISPYARRLAAERGVDYSRISGTGPEGRIIARDVEGAGGGPPAPLRPAATVAAVGMPAALPDEELPPIEVGPEEADVEEASFRLRTQAHRVLASQRAIPHFFLTRGVDVTELLKRKDRLTDELGATLTHVVMHACVRTLEGHPEINRSYDRGRVVKWKSVRLGLAVDTDAGLTVAVLPNAQGLSLAALAEQTRSLVERARAGKLSAEERMHATFTITNLGMLDVEQFEPIINPPSAVTLAVASALPSAIVRNGAVHVGQVMKLTAACDHRIVDGATAARFLKDLRTLLEDPDRLLEGA